MAETTTTRRTPTKAKAKAPAPGPDTPTTEPAAEPATEPAPAPAVPERTITLPGGRTITLADREKALADLAAPFPQDWIEKLPKVMRKDDQDKGRCEHGSRYSADGYYCGAYHARALHLDYVGHAGITMRLNEAVGPDGWDWSFKHVDLPGWLVPVVGALTEKGDIAGVQALVKQYGVPVQRDGGLWIDMTILGVTKPGFGDAQGKTGPNATKELIGDAIRNAAMRFGVATYLWAKSEHAHELREFSAPDADLPDPETVLAELREAWDATDPVAAIIAVGNKHGRETLEQVWHEGEGGARQNLSQVVVQFIERARTREKQRLQARAMDTDGAHEHAQHPAHESAHEGAQDAREDRTEYPPAGAHEHAQEYVHEESPAERAERARQALAQAEAHSEARSAQAQPALSREMAWLLSEIDGQAEVAGVTQGVWFEQLKPEGQFAGESIEDFKTKPVPLMRMVANARPWVIDRMREQGRVTEADVYAQADRNALVHWPQIAESAARAADQDTRAQEPAAQV